jgi:hypothetical protein
MLPDDIRKIIALTALVVFPYPAILKSIDVGLVFMPFPLAM